MKKRIFLIFLACLLAFTSFSADAHPGRLDSNGGHWNHKTGTYHYHRGIYASRRKTSTRKSRKSKTRRKRSTRRGRRAFVASSKVYV